MAPRAAFFYSKLIGKFYDGEYYPMIMVLMTNKHVRNFVNDAGYGDVP